MTGRRPLLHGRRPRTEPSAGLTATGRASLIRPAIATRNVLIPGESRRGAAAGVSLITRSRWYAVAAQWSLWGAAAAFGPRAVPGERVVWEIPAGPEIWTELRRALPAFDELAVYARPQVSRSGLAMLLLRGSRPVGFLKLRDDPAELDREERALSAFPGGRAETFRVPQVLDRGETAGLHWLLISAMPPRPAAPARRTPVGPLLADLRRHLGGVFDRPKGVPEHWEPMHGDLTAWNLRRNGRGLPWLIDWEDAGWAPPGADLFYYRASNVAAFGRPPGRASMRGTAAEPVPDDAEVAEFWLDRLSARSATDHDAGFTARLAATLSTIGS
ncbi:phosphotransferase family protein [Myceligenerans indicum]|uniref:Phosphotransferase n=1 Tax=Myceligenerans indicum TaxID=2593663 RepID=A0ABS1LEK2_9MICO|nr:phosphotransferase [Myceligenerans indicum]MBL0884715.1 phosphotransferase [Myceligenerans indicum]